MEETSVAVVVAVNPRNCGMYSVDLAAMDFFHRHQFAFDFFCPPYQRKATRGGIGRIEYRPLVHFRDMSAYSHVAYWGDFTTNPSYALTDFTERTMRFSAATTPETAHRKWFDIHMPPADRRQKVVSVGQSFQTLGDIETDLTRRARNRLARGFDAILPRDTISLSRLAEQVPGAAGGAVTQGMDPAFLLRNHPAARPGDLPESPFFSFAFHRSELPDPDRLIAHVAEGTGLAAVPLEGWLRADIATIDDIYRRNAALIAGARFVLTDTYHCCVNAWALGTPAIGMGRQASQMEGTLGDYKKRVLFEMHGQSAHYFEVASKDVDADAEAAVIEDARRLAQRDADWDNHLIETQRAAFDATLADCFAT